MKLTNDHPTLSTLGTIEIQILILSDNLSIDGIDDKSNKFLDDKILIFGKTNQTILNILSNFIFHEIIICNYKGLPWLQESKIVNL